MKAVVLARGLGTRMRRTDDEAALTPEQAVAADAGMKAMMPVRDGRPFLHYVLSGLADGGVREVCLVVAPDAEEIRRHFHSELTLQRMRIAFAIQPEPLGTADAVLAAQFFVGSDRFLCLNADNIYPVEAYRALKDVEGSALPGFDREALVTKGNIDADRIRKFALLRVSTDGFLEEIVEKPDAKTFDAMGPHALVSMNLWAFTPTILDACRRVKPSARGELELPDAVRIAIKEFGERFRVLPFEAPVIDLASRRDVESVVKFLGFSRPIL